VREVTEFKLLKPNAMETLMQLFLNGPTWDGDIVSKNGRGQLFEHGLAEREQGWSYLTREGVKLATTADVKGWADKRWYRKQQCL
jgi:hypothetical protein